MKIAEKLRELAQTELRSPLPTDKVKRCILTLQRVGECLSPSHNRVVEECLQYIQKWLFVDGKDDEEMLKRTSAKYKPGVLYGEALRSATFVMEKLEQKMVEEAEKYRHNEKVYEEEIESLRFELKLTQDSFEDMRRKIDEVHEESIQKEHMLVNLVDYTDSEMPRRG